MSSSSSASESSSPPAPTKKRIRIDVESSDGSDSDHNDSGDAQSSDERAVQQKYVPVADTTVLSHAERRRQKKKQRGDQHAAEAEPTSKKRKLDKDGNTSSEATAATRPKPRAKTAPTDDPRRQKRQNSVWVGNLSFQTTQDALRGFFDGVGTITRVHMPTIRGKQGKDENMGFAYVDFETSDAKVIAITLSERTLNGRNLLIKDGGDFTGRPAKTKAEASEDSKGGTKLEQTKNAMMGDEKGPSKAVQKILRTQKHPPAPTLFLGNLGFETTENAIRELFEMHRHGRHKDKGKEKRNTKVDETEDSTAKSKDVWIRKIRMGTFEDSGACKGFAFVDFTSIEHATDTLINPRNHRLNGRDLTIEYASSDAVRRGGGPRHARGDGDRKGKDQSGKQTQRNLASAPYTKQHRPLRRNYVEPEEAEDGGDVEEVEAKMATPHSRRPNNNTGHDRSHRRAKPGAALAQAQRQSAAILPGQGEKIVF